MDNPPGDQERQLLALEEAIRGAVLSDEDREALRHLRPHAQRLARIAQMTAALGFLGDALKWAVGIAAATIAVWQMIWNGR